jgi:hypothetical protein
MGNSPDEIVWKLHDLRDPENPVMVAEERYGR